MAAAVEAPISASGSHSSLRGLPNGGGSSDGPAAGLGFDVTSLRAFLLGLLPLLMSVTPHVLEDSMFAGDDWLNLASSFASDPGSSVLYANAVRKEEGSFSASEEPFEYHLVNQASYTPRHVSSIALIKRVPTLDGSTPLAHQLHVLTLFGPASAARPAPEQAKGALPEADAEAEVAPAVRESPYEALHSVVHHVMAPWFEAYVSSRESKQPSAAMAAKGKDSEAKMGIPMTKRKFAELELSLQHLVQAVEIPEVHLAVHPVVRATVERCQAEGRRARVEDVEPASLLSDSSFLNALQSQVNQYIRDIQAITKLDREVTGSAAQEINFWLSMEKVQHSIEQQLASDPIELTLAILGRAKRFHATVSFHSDTGVKDLADKVHNYNLLMRDFPLNELLSATDLDKCAEALDVVFGHLNKKLRLSPYPVKRALPFVEAITRDLNDTLLKILASQRIMFQSFERFCDIVAAAQHVFQTFDEGTKAFVTTARELTRKRAERFIPIKINPVHAKLRERLNYIAAFRKTHEQLRVMVSSGKALALATTSKQSGAQNLAELEMADEINAAYDGVKVIDVLDASQEGTEIWSAAEAAYNERVARVENSLISRLRDLLGQAKSAREMLSVLSQFNSLFVRPKVRGAVQEYQQQLLQSVKTDIQGLHDKFKAQYRPSESAHLTQARDLPEIAGAIIWARQIERQLNVYMRRVEDVLGKGWELYAEGQKLQNESETFRRKLDTRPLFEGWLHDIDRRDMSISGRLFEVHRSRATGTYELAVNFEPSVIVLFKEVRNLIWLGYQIPHATANLAKDAKRVYPMAVSLMETVRTFNQTTALVKANPAIACLVAQLQVDVQALISQGMALRWEHFANAYESHRAMSSFPGGPGAAEGRGNKQVAFVRQFAAAVSLFQDKTNELVDMQREAQQTVAELSTCAYTFAAFSERLQRLQATIDRLNLDGYPNLEEWVAALDVDIERVLLERLRFISIAWCEEFARERSASGDDGRGPTNTRRRAAQDKQRDLALQAALERDHVELAPTTHEVRIQNQVIYLDPPLEHARARWFRQLQEHFATVCGLRRVQSARYEIGIQMRKGRDTSERTYVSLLARFDEAALRRPFALIEAKLAEAGAYVRKWLQFQSLWDLEPEHIFAQLGDSLADWQQLLTEIRRTRSTFDNSGSAKSFGIIVVDYEQVSSKVSFQYDQLQRDILARFGAKLGNEMREVSAAMHKARTDLEGHSIEASSTAQTVTFITTVQDLKRKVKRWAPQIDVFSSGQKTLERQRYQFPADWLYVDQVEGEWSAFNEILNRKNATIQEQMSGLQMKINAEDRIVSDKIGALVAEWEAQKPIQGTLKADQAMNAISTFELRVNRLVEDRDLVVRAKEALDLEHTPDGRLEPVIEELRDLKAVWTALSGTWAQLAELKEMRWNDVQPRKIRQQLDSLLNQTKEMPSRMRQYAAFEYVQETLRALLKSNVLLTDLRSEAMRERHWRSLFKQLKMTSHYTPSSMTLGTVWDMDLKRHEGTIKAVILTAQGELALEEYLKLVRETWTNYTLDLIAYQSKCRLIRGWDNLMSIAGEHLNGLRSMTLSPHYKVFEEEASLWEDRLARIHVLFLDTWIDVQRQWVYLEGIFSGSAEIRHILPVESSRFDHLNTEFITLMKKVYKSPFILDVLNIPGVQKSLDRLLELLSKIQKALRDYLERERANYPRFYFISDEDLLSILGNPKDVARIAAHLGKMFPGAASLKLDEEQAQIDGVYSREGELLPLQAPITLAKFGAAREWLAALEDEMRFTISSLAKDAAAELESFYSCAEGAAPAQDAFLAFIERYPGQAVTVSCQAAWTRFVDETLTAGQDPAKPLSTVSGALELLADFILTDIDVLMRKKVEILMIELVHQRDVLRRLIAKGVRDVNDFAWQSQMRFRLEPASSKDTARLGVACRVEMAGNSFAYAWEWLGCPERIVTTPLTHKLALSMTQALGMRKGTNAQGPAGSGKSESSKLIASELGQHAIIFCCDESFDVKALSRILTGACRTGAAVILDEFNRCSSNTLSAISQQILLIQQALASTTDEGRKVELNGNVISVHPSTSTTITQNPTYAGRQTLPRNLTKLFRDVAMAAPDRELIAQVMLFSQGFRTAEKLALKAVPFFNLCAEQLSPQPHYDFGLRALKSVLVSAGQLKRDALSKERAEGGSSAPLEVAEQELLMQSITETMVPKLVAEDVPLLASLLSDVFPGVEYKPVNLDELRARISEICKERKLVDEGLWQQKVIQLYQIQKISHGLMLVGPSGTGKTQAWQVLLAALEKLEGVEGVSYVIDPKAGPKEALYGTLDPTTREWNDGLFTQILRRIIDNVRGESSKRHWIIFDGDVDPEWVENLNSVLDDNKLLTLPNGERLNLPPNVRVMFEVEHLRYATLATVSRCGMIWFSEDVVKPAMMFRNYLDLLRSVPLGTGDDDDAGAPGAARRQAALNEPTPEMNVQEAVADIISPFFEPDALVERALEQAAQLTHIMDFTVPRVLGTLFSLVNKTVRNIVEYNQQHADFPLGLEQTQAYTSKRFVVSLVWSFAGDSKLDVRAQLGEWIRGQTGVDMPSLGPGESLIDYDVQISTADYVHWTTKVPTIEVETNAVLSADVVIPTMDTIRHEEVLYSWLSEHKPLMLCGPPGSGKTMTLFSALRKLPDQDVVDINFSSATTPELILKTLEQRCEYRKTPSGVVLAPSQIGRWIVLFCDEINLPAQDKYGTQRVISFLRQLVEKNGFWRISDKAWVRLERIQFVGACNPPTDPGRVPLSHRFLRHAPLVMVDYPGELSLQQIYGTFFRGLLKVTPHLRGYAEAITASCVQVYLASQARFTPDVQAHYIYSPRELTRWMRGIYEAIKDLDSLSVEGLVRIWAHEGLRLFQDRLVEEVEKAWTDSLLDSVAEKNFPTMNRDEALSRPIVMSNWLTRTSSATVSLDALKQHTTARLAQYSEEELDTKLVLHDSVLFLATSVDRVLRQRQGHLLLIGKSGSGRTTVARFVAWLVGLSVFTIATSRKYSMADFDEDLRVLLKRAGCQGEKMCFIIDESQIKDPAFLERLNTLLANGEAAGIFEGDEYSALMTACKEGSQRDGLMLDSNEELYAWFRDEVCKNLSVVFTMNPPEHGTGSKAAASPALFNRCVLLYLW